MKYFKDQNHKDSMRDPFGKNEGNLWNQICKMFNQDKKRFTTSIERLAIDLRNENYNKDKIAYEKAVNKISAKLEDNSDGTIFTEY